MNFIIAKIANPSIISAGTSVIINSFDMFSAIYTWYYLLTFNIYLMILLV